MNAKLLIQQKSASTKQCPCFTLRIKQWPCVAKHKVVLIATAIKPNRPSYLRASVRLINDSKKGRSYCL